MIDLPDFDKAFEYENGFYLASDVSRLAKAMAQFELFKMALELSGSIVECGVFKGASLVRFATYRQLLAGGGSRKIIGFDTFDQFPETDLVDDQRHRENFIDQAGSESIGREQLLDVLARKGISEKVELIQGNILETLPRYVADNPQLKISLLNLDTDIYEPAKCILENLHDRVVPGGVVILDNYGVHYGETKAVDEFFAGREVVIRKLPYAATPSYLIKE